MQDPLYVLGVLGLLVALSEWLARHTWLRHLGSALLVIVLTAISANLGLVPTYGTGHPIYDGIFAHVAPLAIFFLLLRVNLADLKRAGAPLVLLFLLGSLGTVCGVFCGLLAAGGFEAFGELTFAVAGMFVATYTGGSVNFNAVALEYGVVKEGGLYLAASVVDSAMTTVWMAATVAIPRLLQRWQPGGGEVLAIGTPDTGEEEDTETTHHLDLALVGALGALSVWAAREIAEWGRTALGFEIPSILILSTLALGLAQVPLVQRLRGARLLGMAFVMLFLSVIGALCDVGALLGMGEIGGRLILFCAVVVCVHGTIVFGVARWLRLDPVLAAVASQANIGGGTSALALARSLGRGDLVLPAILIGALGSALGTYLGFLTASLLR
ncbi:MAG: hypothetical protein CMJ89_10725 [Planctomycetes bacterium]|nr:hypothetical protein [Planctomycetota bacterium]